MKTLQKHEISRVSGGAANVYEALGPQFHQAMMDLGVNPQMLHLETLDATVAAGAFADAAGLAPEPVYKVAAIAFADGMEFGAHHPFGPGPL